MAIDFNNFLNWAESKFSGDIIVKNNEIRINSIFTADCKHHLWCNPYGGKNEVEDGCYRCFYTDKKGTLIGLVMLVENCSYKEAKQILSANINIENLEEKINDFFANKTYDIDSYEDPKIKLPEYCFLINNMSDDNFYKDKAINYLTNRKLTADKLMYCTDGLYKNRIIIPYYDKNYNLIYYNSRHIGNSKLRYLGPPKEIGVGKSDVLFLPTWPKENSKIYLTEGEFDSLSLFTCGFFSAACGGKHLSQKQIFMLKNYKICLSLDQDNAGFNALVDMGNKLLSNGIEVSYVRPPKEYKDWNLMLKEKNKIEIQKYIKENEKPFDEWTGDELMFDQL